jgi:hypothetical protein
MREKMSLAGVGRAIAQKEESGRICPSTNIMDLIHGYWKG